jgi:DNA repair protein RadD
VPTLEWGNNNNMINIFNQEINKSQLWDCQSNAYEKLLNHFLNKTAEKHVLIQMPTGTGKSTLIAIAPFKISKERVLILTPNLILSKQLELDLDIINNSANNIYKKRAIFSDDLLEKLEFFVLRLENTANSSDIEEHQIIISNYQQLSNIEKWFKGHEELIDLIIIDEAHHQKAQTYQKIIKFFTNAKIISLTATPFRTDGKKIEGKKIYTYHFKEAIKNEYIRNIKTSNVSPKQIKLSFSDQNNKIYSFEDIIKMKEEAWFRNNIALSQDCCDSIAQKANEKLQDLKTNFSTTSHQIIASAMSIRHAREFVKPAFEKLNLKVGLVSSESEDKKTNSQILEKLLQGKLDVIINVGMLGEGFDHKKLGVAAIFRPFATLNPYIQFIGRAIRKNNDTKYCWVVSHIGLNQIKRFEEFKFFDNEDKDFLQKLFTENKKIKEEDFFIADDDENKSDNNSNSNSVKITEIGDEILDFESQFVKSDEKIKAAEIAIDKLTEEERKKLFLMYGSNYDSVSIKKKKKIKPVDKRRAEKSFLNEKAKSITTDILKAIGLSSRFYYRDFNFSKTNFVWVQSQISRDINKKLGIKFNQRRQLSNKQLSDFKGSGQLEEIKKNRLNYFKKKLEEKS